MNPKNNSISFIIFIVAFISSTAFSALKPTQPPDSNKEEKSSTRPISAADIQELRTASTHQQKAIGNIIGALKELKKAIMNAPFAQDNEQLKKDEQNPFKDKQEYKSPKLDPQINPELNLKKIIKKQKELIKDLEKSENNQGTGRSDKKSTSDRKSDNARKNQPISGKTEKKNMKNKDAEDSESGKKPASKEKHDSKYFISKQREISEELFKLKTNSTLSNAVKKELEKALENSQKTDKALLANEKNIAQSNAEKSLLKMHSALRKIIAESNMQTQNELNTAQKKINDTLRKNSEKEQNKNSTSDIQKLVNSLNNKAGKENKSGSFRNAEKLADLAEKLHNEAKKLNNASDKEKIKKLLKKISSEIRKARLENRKPAKQLSDILKKLKQNSKELEFFKKHPDKTTQQQMNSLLKETEMLMQDAIALMKKLKPDYSFKKQIQQQTKQQNNEKRNNRSTQPGPGQRTMPYLIFVHKINKPEHLKLDTVINDIAALTIDSQKILDKSHPAVLTLSFSPDEVPDQYKSAVSDYFKNLSESYKNNKKRKK